MGEPVVQVKSEDGSDSKKIKLEQEDGPDAKKIKLEQEDGPDAKKIKLEQEEEHQNEPSPVTGDAKLEAKDIKKENGDATDVKKENGGEDESASTEQKTAEDMGEPDLAINIIAQIEYYFGDVNLPKDKFLQEQIKLEDGWVPLEVMLRFNRLNALTKNASTIVSALKDSSKLIEVNEDGTKIRRSPSKPLPEMNEEWHKLVHERTVYCKGFPLTETRMSEYIKFFKPYGPVENVSLRKYLDKSTKQYLFKGSVYVLFETKELAEKFLALESLSYNEKELIRMTHAAHNEEKKKEKEERWGKKVKKDNADDNKEKAKVDFAKGCIFRIDGFSSEDLTREVIKAALVSEGVDVAFIQFNKGEKEALVRLQSSEDGAATQFLKKLEEENKKITLGEEEVKLTPVEGQDEETFLQKTREAMSQRGHKGQRGGQRGRQNHHRGGHKGGFRGHKRGRSPARDGPPTKQTTVSS